MGVVQEMIERDGVARGVPRDGEMIEAEAVVLALDVDEPRRGAPAAARARAQGYRRDAGRRRPSGPRALVDYRTADGRALEPEIVPRPDGDVYVCGMADTRRCRSAGGGWR